MPKIVDHSERRRHLAGFAVDAIAASGLDDVKLASIARAAGVTTGAIAHYFPDKDALLAAALEEVCTRLMTKVAAPDLPHALEDLASCLPVTPENRKDWRVWLAYWGRAPFSEKLRQIHTQYYLDIETAIGEALVGRTANPRLAAAALIAAIDGVGTRATLEPDAWPPERQRAMLAELVSPLLSTFNPKPA